MNAILKDVFINKLSEKVKKYNNTMYVELNKYMNYHVKTIIKKPKFKVAEYIFRSLHTTLEKRSVLTKNSLYQGHNEKFSGQWRFF